MEVVLVKLAAAARPVVSISFAEGAFEAAALAVFGLLIGALLMVGAVRKSLRLSSVDILIAAFVLWCVCISLIYLEDAHLGEMAKLIIPLVTYTAVKAALRDRADYVAVLRWMLIGFAVPLIGSAVLIAAGSKVALGYVAYWTELPRWEGLYTGSHNLGHSATLCLMVGALYLTLRAGGTFDRILHLNKFELGLLGVLGLAALYAVYMSQVRTAMLGLMVFAGVYLYYFRLSVLVVGSIATAVLAALTVPYWLPAILPEVAVQQQGVEVTALDIGSGRPRFWLNDISVFLGLPLDRQLAGVGIGRRESIIGDEELIGHNDWLEILTQTGLVGLGLFAALQVAILRKILQMPGRDRYAYLALFLSVNLMMLVSNSYAWRIQVGHLYYMVLAFVELSPLARVTAGSPVAKSARVFGAPSAKGGPSILARR